jgi:hypothetical protein
VKPVLAAAVLVGLAVRLAFALGYWTGQPLTRDEREYLSLARGIASGRGAVYDREVLAGGVEPFGRAPGYPFFLALTGGGRRAVSEVPTSVKVAQSVVGAVGVAMLGLVAGRLAGPAAAGAAAMVAALYPPLVWIASYAFSESIAWPLGLVAAWLFDRAVFGSRPASALLVCGVVTGLSILVRPALLVFLALACLWLLWRRHAAWSAILTAGALCAILPWTIRTYAREGRLELVASEGGVTFWTGNHPLAVGEGDLAANPALKRASQALRLAHPGASEAEMEPVYYAAAFHWIASHPGDWLGLEARKIFYSVVPLGPSYRLHSSRYFAASVVSYGLLLAAAVIGLVRLADRRGRLVGLWLLAGSALVTGVVFFPQERFRIPAIDPALVVCASGIAVPRRKDR